MLKVVADEAARGPSREPESDRAGGSPADAGRRAGRRGRRVRGRAGRERAAAGGAHRARLAAAGHGAAGAVGGMPVFLFRRVRPGPVVRYLLVPGRACPRERAPTRVWLVAKGVVVGLVGDQLLVRRGGPVQASASPISCQLRSVSRARRMYHSISSCAARSSPRADSAVLNFNPDK